MPPLLKGGGYDLPKIEIRGRVQNALQERARGNKPEKEGLMQKWGGGGVATLQFSSNTFTVCACGESKVPFIPFGSSVF